MGGISGGYVYSAAFGPNAGASAAGCVVRNNTAFGLNQFEVQNLSAITFKEQGLPRRSRSENLWLTSCIPNGFVGIGGRWPAAALVAGWVDFWYSYSPIGGFYGIFAQQNVPLVLTSVPDPIGYYAYAFTLYYDGANFARVHVNGDLVTYDAFQSVLAGGGAVVETQILLPVIPPYCKSFLGSIYGIGGTADAAGALQMNSFLRVTPGINAVVATCTAVGVNPGSQYLITGPEFEFPNESQTLYYINAVAAGLVPQLYVAIRGYRCANS